MSDSAHKNSVHLVLEIDGRRKSAVFFERLEAIDLREANLTGALRYLDQEECAALAMLNEHVV